MSHEDTAAIQDAHVKDMGWAVWGSSQSPTQEVIISDMKFTGTLSAISMSENEEEKQGLVWAENALKRNVFWD